MSIPCLIAFRDGRDGRLKADILHATDETRETLTRLLDRLAAEGQVVHPTITTLDDRDALSSLAEVPPTFHGTAPPLTIMPVSAFSPDPEQPHVLYATASLFGAVLDLEAIAMEQAPDGSWKPHPAVVTRYAPWQAASGLDDVRPVALPGYGGHFAVFACPLGV